MPPTMHIYISPNIFYSTAAYGWPLSRQGIGACPNISPSQKNQLEKEDSTGMWSKWQKYVGHR